MNGSVARAYCTTRWKLAQRLHKWIIWQLVKATVSSYPSPASAPVIASSIRGTPSPILPWSIKAPDLAQGAELEVAVPNLDGHRVRLAGRGLLLVGSEQKHALTSDTRPYRDSRSNSSTKRAARATYPAAAASRGRGKRAQGQRWPPAPGRSDGGTRHMPVQSSHRLPEPTKSSQGYSKSERDLG
jgi:hypothetical protein